MFNRQKHRTLVLTISLLLFGVLFFNACNHKAEEIKQLADAETKMGAEQATNIQITYADSAVLKAKIKAPLMERFANDANPYMEMKKGLRADFYNKDHIVESTLKANYGISYETTKIIHLKKDVHIVNLKGEELSSEELFWDQNKQKIYTEKYVTIKRSNEIIYGDGFESNENFTKYKILHPTGRVNIKKESE
jgi:LPS export ABC transporter protein LptC